MDTYVHLLYCTAEMQGLICGGSPPTYVWLFEEEVSLPSPRLTQRNLSLEFSLHPHVALLERAMIVTCSHCKRRANREQLDVENRWGGGSSSGVGQRLMIKNLQTVRATLTKGSKNRVLLRMMVWCRCAHELPSLKSITIDKSIG